MNLMEYWFGFYPDGGDGSLEVLLIGLLGTVVLIFCARTLIQGFCLRKALSRELGR